uniref:Uncharacterized protein n=1 Tax=Plectus sambesii TaxID=2011161 RepID=A0A914VY69_9BILA
MRHEVDRTRNYTRTLQIKLRPAHQNDLRASEPLSIPLIYTIQQNSIKPANSGGNNAEHPANQMLLMQSKAAQAVGDCCIWMAVRHLMERYEHRR